MKRKPHAKIGAFVKREPTKPQAFVFHETNDRSIDYTFPEKEPISYTHEVPRSTYVKPRNLTSEHQMHRDHEKNARVAKLLEGKFFLDSTYLPDCCFNVESEQTAFRCATNEKSVKTILKMEQIKLEESRKNEHEKVSWFGK